MNTLVKAMFITLLLGIGYTSVSAHLVEVHRNRHKNCKDSGYLSVTIAPIVDVLGNEDCYHLYCDGCGSIPCKVPLDNSCPKRRLSAQAVDLATERFGRGELTGGIYMSTSDGILRATWVGSIAPNGDEVQSIRVTTE